MVDDMRPQPEDNQNKNFLEENIQEPEAINDQPSVDSLLDNNIGSVAGSQKKGIIKKTAHKFYSRGLALWPSNRKQKIIGGLIVAALIIGGGSGIYALKKLFEKSSTPDSPIVSKQEPKTTEPSRLTGVEIPIAVNKHPVTAIMIENSPDARPQSGLRDAGIIFEAVAEGGITRFNALFLEGRPSYIGPVRSVRPYYIDLFLPFDAAIAHAGGSGEGLAKVRSLGVKDLDYFKNFNAYHRVNSRYAPHNLYTSISALDKASKARGFKSSKFTSWERKKEVKGKKPTARKIDFALSGFLYNPHYDYDAKSNTYKRSEGGRPHTDERSHKQLAPKVVIALVMNYSKNGIYSVYKTSGSGQMFVFQDGQVQKGTWKKSGSKSQFKFLDQNGQKLALDAGQTWVTLVAGSNAVTYSP